jgi:signal peptidase II
MSRAQPRVEPRVTKKLRSFSARAALVLGVAAAVFFLDSASKAWAIDTLARSPRVLVPDALELVLAQNPGVAFSFFAEAPSLVRLGILPALALGASILLFTRGTARRGSPTARVGAALVIGGAIGNALDRVRLGYVVDFIHAHAGAAFDYPVFNVADIAVLAGALMLVIDVARRGEPAS